MIPPTPTTALQELLKRLWHHLGKRRRVQFRLLMVLMLFSTFTEVISLGAVIPFLGALISPERVFNHPMIQDVVRGLGITSPSELVLPLTVGFAVAALITGVSRILLLWCSTRLAFASGADIGVEVYRRTLYQPYSAHISRNSSEVISGITNKINEVVFGILQRLLTVITSAALVLTIAVALFLFDPAVASIVTLVFGFSYGGINWLTRKRLKSNGQRIAKEQTQVVKILQEGLGGIRDILLDGVQSLYSKIYSKSDHALRRAQGNNVFIAGSPRYIIETLGIILIATLAYSLSLQPGGVARALPILGALALGAQRMLPALQQAFHAWSTVIGNQAALSDVIQFLDQPLPPEAHPGSIPPAVLPFEKTIRFSGVRFRYHPEGPWALDDFNLEIPKGWRLGFVGSSGSGKSTGLDLLMGLLRPTEGQVLVDGQCVEDKNIRSWQKVIAHVPQHIFLADATLAQNIAFGVPQDEIDLQRVKAAAQQVQIADFIESRPQSYQGLVGERGISLSGGQRQRIGIARALYKQAKVLVLDEATSALDNATEQSVMTSIQELGRDLTILIIAHRITTVKDCDLIVEIENGKIVAQGTYEQLFENSPSFRKMTGVVV